MIENKVWVSFIWASCQSSEFVKLYTDMSFLKIPLIVEIPDNERIQKKLEKFRQIESFETKTTNVCEISCNDILFNEDKSVYQV